MRWYDPQNGRTLPRSRGTLVAIWCCLGAIVVVSPRVSQSQRVRTGWETRDLVVTLRNSPSLFHNLLLLYEYDKHFSCLLETFAFIFSLFFKVPVRFFGNNVADVLNPSTFRLP